MFDKLATVQFKLKAPKNQKNDYGNYKYRSCEDILEAVKPLLHEVKASLVISDKVEMVGDRFYVVATARFTDLENGETIESSAFAREPQVQKGMSDSQLTGTASSYARKYALNGLFLIDDTKDVDTNEHKEEVNNRQKQAQNEGKKPAEKPAEPVIEVKESKNAMIAKVLNEMCRTSTGIKSIMGTYKKEYVSTVGIEHNLARLTEEELADALQKFSTMKAKS